MQIKFNPAACFKDVEGKNHRYIGRAAVMSHDGKQYEFAIKTRPNSFAAEEVQIRIDGKWQVTTDYPAKLTSDFADFLRLLTSCFGNKLARNKLFLDKPRLLMDMTPKGERPACSTLMTNYICLINGEFLHVRKQRIAFSYATTYSTRAVDMSDDWKVVNVSLETEALIAEAVAYYKNKLSRYALVEYRKDMVNRGAWMS